MLQSENPILSLQYSKMDPSLLFFQAIATIFDSLFNDEWSMDGSQKMVLWLSLPSKGWFVLNFDISSITVSTSWLFVAVFHTIFDELCCCKQNKLIGNMPFQVVWAASPKSNQVDGYGYRNKVSY